MANKPGLPEFFADPQSNENMRRQFIEVPLEAAQQSVLSSMFEVGSLLSALPDAFLASQNRELDRVKKSGKDDDARVALLQASIDRATILRTTALRGQTRAKRAVVALTDRDHVFHGFVSDAEFVPLKGLTVRLTDNSKTSNTKPLTTIIESDGYFRIPLEQKTADRRGSTSKTGASLVERITDLFSSVTEPGSVAGATDHQETAAVEILKKSKLIYRDPAPVVRGQGSVYREYVISADRPPSASDFREFVSEQKIILDATDTDNA